MDWNGAQIPPNIPNNNLSTSGNINQQPVHISPQMLEVWRRTQQGDSVVPAPVLTQALQLGPLPNEQYEVLRQQITALESYIPVIREHLQIRNLAYLGQMALQQQAQANPAASIHEVSPTTSPRQNMNNMHNSQQAQQFAARQNHVQQFAYNRGSSNMYGYPNNQQGRPQQYVHLTSQGIPQQPGGSMSNGHIAQQTGIPRGWANAESSGAIPQPSLGPQSGAPRPVSVSMNANIHQMQPQAANADPAQTGRSAAQEAIEWERSLNAMPINWQSKPSVTQAPPGPPHPPAQTSVAQTIGSAEQPRLGNGQSSAPVPMQGAPSAPSTSIPSRPPNPSPMNGSGESLKPLKPMPPFTTNSGPRQAPHVSSPIAQAPPNRPLTTAPPSSSTAAGAHLPKHHFAHMYQAPPSAQPSVPHPPSTRAPQVVQVPQASNRQPAAPSLSTAGPNTQMPSSSPYAQNVQRKNLVHNFLAALGKRKAPAADIDHSSEGPNKRRAEGGSTGARVQVGPSSSVSAPTVASVPKVKPAAAPAPASIPAPILAPVQASAPVPISAPIPISAPRPAPAPRGATTTSAPAPVPGPSGTNAQIDRRDTQSAKFDSSKTQEKQKGGIEGAMAVPVTSTSNQQVTVATEELTRQQREKLIAAIIAPPGPRPQTVSVPVRPPTAQAPPTPVSVPPAPVPAPPIAAPAAPAPAAPPAPSTSVPSTSAPSTSAPAPSKITPIHKPNPSVTTRDSPRSAIPVTRPVPSSQRTVAPTPKKVKASVEPIIKQEEDEDDEEKFREVFAVWDLRKRGKGLQTPRKKKEVINLVTPSRTASRLKGEEKAKTVGLESTLVLPPPSDLEPLFFPSSPSVQLQSEGLTAPPSLPHTRIKYEDEDRNEESFVWGPPPGTNRAYVDVPIVNGRGYARHKNKSENKGKERIREWELREEEETGLAAAPQWSGKHDDEILRVVKCRWKKCGAVLQSRGHCLKHVQVMHVGELEDAPEGWEKLCLWEGCAVDSFLTPKMLLDHVGWHVRGKWLCRFNKCLRIFDTSERRKAHHFSRHLSWETYKPLVPQLKLSNGVSRRFESPPRSLPDRSFTWDRGWYADVVANPNVANPGAGSPNVLASEGVNSLNSHHPLVPRRRARDGRSHAGTGTGQPPQTQTQMEPTAARDEYAFLVPYFPPDFYCGDLQVGLDVLELQGLQGEGGYEDGGKEQEQGSPPDELLLVGGVQQG